MPFTNENAPWRAQLDAALEASPLSTEYALATSGAGDKRPRVRYVEHQGFSPSGLLLVATTRTSPHFADVKQNHHIELAWNLSPTLTFRIRGRAVVVGERNEFRAAGLMHSYYLPLQAPESGYKYWSDTRERVWRATHPAGEGHGYGHEDGWEAGPEGVDNAHYGFVLVAIVPRRVEVVDAANGEATTYLQDRTGKWTVVPGPEEMAILERKFEDKLVARL